MKALHRLTILLTLGVLLAACVGPPPAPQPTPAGQVFATPTPAPPVATPTVPVPGAAADACLARGDFPPLLPGLRYGINSFLFGTDTRRVLTLSKTAGFTWVRQQIHWRDIEGERLQFVWEPLDRLVQAAREYDLRIMLSIVRSPDWATADGGDGLPADPATLAEFLGRLATRYRGEVMAYEIWNEPNLAHENNGTPATAAHYLPLLQAGYAAIKRADPCALVLSAPLASSNNPDPALARSDLAFFEELYRLDDGAFLRAADAVALHPGGGPHPPAARWPDDSPERSSFYFRHIERVHEIMQRHGDERQVWLTEIGWSVERARGAPEPVTQQQQGRYLVEALWYTRQHYPWVAAVFVWNLNFNVLGAPGDEKSTFSLLNKDWSVRPAYLALQHEVNRLRELEQPPDISIGADYRFAWTFGGRGKLRTHPIISPGGTVYAASDPGHLYALTPNGALRWKFDAPAETRSAPAYAPDGTLYLGSLGVVTALQPDGSIEWTTRLRGRIQGSPLYHDGVLYVGTRDGELQAFDRQGQERWWYSVHDVAIPPGLGRTSDGAAALLAGTRSGHLHKLTTGGEVLWHIDLQHELDAAPVGDAAGNTYVVTEAGRVIALDSQGAKLWETPLQATVVASPLLGGNGSIYVAARDGTLSALDMLDGSVQWRFASGSDMVATPTRAPDGTLYVGTDDERLLALAPNGELRWQAEVGGMVRAQPTLGTDGMLYITTVGGRVYAFRPAP